MDTGLYLPNEAAGCDSGGCQPVTFTSCAMGEDVPTLQGTADYLVWVKGKISNRNTFIIAARILQNIRLKKTNLYDAHIDCIHMYTSTEYMKFYVITQYSQH